MRRLFWLGIGVGIGVATVLYLTRKFHQAVDTYKPTNLAKELTESLVQFGSDIKEAAIAGNEARAQHESELLEQLGTPQASEQS